jgi:hypothetical protein
MLRNHYPGVQPFKTSDRDLFFRRDADIDDLHDFLMLEKRERLFWLFEHLFRWINGSLFRLVRIWAGEIRDGRELGAKGREWKHLWHQSIFCF